MISRWKTVISDFNSLGFVSINDTGEGKAIFENSHRERYEVLLDGWCGPYVIVGEEYLVKYWNQKPEGIGWTFTINSNDSYLKNAYSLEGSKDEYVHYVISSEDSCIEILSQREPIIRKS